MERSVKVDWLNFTTKRSLSDVIALFSFLPNPLIPEEKGMYGYNFRLSSTDGVMVLYSAGRSDIHIQLSGRGCDMELWKLLELVAPSDYVTRLDIAIDCIGSGFTCEEIWGLLQQGSFASVSSSIRQCQGLLSRGGKFEEINRKRGNSKPASRLNSGHTIYVGASTSDRMVRIYDKGAEQETGADWLRFEIQLRRESANQFWLCGVNADDFADKALALLNRQIRLFAEGQESKIENNNLDRCELHPFWSRLVEKVGVLMLSLPKPAKELRNAIRYVRNAGASIKMLKQVMPDFGAFFESIVDDAELKARHVAMQDDYMSTVCVASEDAKPYHFDALASLMFGPSPVYQ